MEKCSWEQEQQVWDGQQGREVGNCCLGWHLLAPLPGGSDLGQVVVWATPFPDPWNKLEKT